MRPCVRPLAAAFAVAYLAAGWLAAALHSHADHAAEAACTTCSCGHDHGPAPPASEQPTAPDEHHHGCVVCQYLAQPPLAATAVSVVEIAEPIRPAAEPLAPTFESAFAVVSRSRGPPVA